MNRVRRFTAIDDLLRDLGPGVRHDMTASTVIATRRDRRMTNRWAVLLLLVAEGR